ncbi:hypothetical protein [Halorientalis regularis]|uniref:Uncharacterized protein n=1 Tax=Halorientalis regularis TaxID=660518 RepID=A0A1G7TBE2_9EURY|nr:hypothetical protein [Halorientalis regularis]SDG32613.1 hypothetical protein SAMN05216218_12431 [Halorientalis regularis]
MDTPYTDLTLPFVEKGDVVRLKRPYWPDTSSLHRSVNKALSRLLINHPEIETRDAEKPEEVSLVLCRQDERAHEILNFTHATVVEILDRYSGGELNWRAIDRFQAASGTNDRAGRPVQNVALQLHNPSTGLVYYDRGAGTRGIPSYVDFHTAQLSLIQKHDRSYEQRTTDIGNLHRSFGITEAEHHDPHFDAE